MIATPCFHRRIERGGFSFRGDDLHFGAEQLHSRRVGSRQLGVNMQADRPIHRRLACFDLRRASATSNFVFWKDATGVPNALRDLV